MAYHTWHDYGYGVNLHGLEFNSPERVVALLSRVPSILEHIKREFEVNEITEPTVEEIAERLEISPSEVVIALESIVDPVSLYEPVFSDGGDTIYVLDQVGDKNDDKNWLQEICIKEAIKDLSDREKKILSLRFMQGKTQMEVSEEIGISQAQVSRLEKYALKKIKS